jgi:hypothetical protein
MQEKILDMKTANKSFANVAILKYLAMTVAIKITFPRKLRADY